MPALSAISLAAKPDLTLSAAEQRQHDPDFVQRCAIGRLADQLPLRWPTPPEVPLSPKPRYRSGYQPPDPARVLQLDLVAWESIGLFDLLLLLVDFSALRPILAQKLYRLSARGRVPFDPVSCFLLFGWQRLNRWSRLETLRKLADPRNADYVRAFGFRSALYPSESGYRYFLTGLSQKLLDDLLGQSLALIQSSGVIPTELLAHAIVSFDGQIHDAASHLRCAPRTCAVPKSHPAATSPPRLTSPASAQPKRRANAAVTVTRRLAVWPADRPRPATPTPATSGIRAAIGTRVAIRPTSPGRRPAPSPARPDPRGKRTTAIAVCPAA